MSWAGLVVARCGQKLQNNSVCCCCILHIKSTFNKAIINTSETSTLIFSKQVNPGCPAFTALLQGYCASSSKPERDIMKASVLDFRFPLCSKMPVISKVLSNGNKGNLSIPLKQNSAVLLLLGESKEDRRFRAGKRESNGSTKLDERCVPLTGQSNWLKRCLTLKWLHGVCFLCASVFWSMPVLQPSMVFCGNTVNTRVFFYTFALNVRSSNVDCWQTHKRAFGFQTWSDALISFTQPEPLWRRATRLIFSWFIKDLWWAVHRPCLRRSGLLCVSFSSFLSTFLICLCVA